MNTRRGFGISAVLVAGLLGGGIAIAATGGSHPAVVKVQRTGGVLSGVSGTSGAPTTLAPSGSSGVTTTQAPTTTEPATTTTVAPTTTTQVVTTTLPPTTTTTTVPYAGDLSAVCPGDPVGTEMVADAGMPGPDAGAYAWTESNVTIQTLVGVMTPVWCGVPQ